MSTLIRVIALDSAFRYLSIFDHIIVTWTRIPPNSSCVSTIVWLHHLDSNEVLGEKSKRELHKDVVWYF